MGAPGASMNGIAIQVATLSSNVQVLARDGILVGFYVGAAGATTSLWDSTNLTTPTNLIMNGFGLPQGWYPFPITVINGLIANVSGKVIFVCQ